MELDLQTLKTEVRAEFGSGPQEILEVLDGGWNRLFRVTVGQQDLMAKFYYHDDRRRLEREFQLLNFLTNHDFPVPRPYLKNEVEQFAVYSFVPGKLKPARELTDTDMASITGFILRLHQFVPNHIDEQFPLAFKAPRSFNDYLANIEARVDGFMKAMQAGEVPPEAAKFARETKIDELIGQLLNDAVSGMSSEELERPLPFELMRLNSVDFGVHNTLFDGDKAWFIDFESGGWDDPLRLVAEFINHEAHREMSQRHKDYFMERYLNESGLPPLVTDRFATTNQLVAVVWVANQLFNMSPERIKSRKFADINFDLDAHVARHIGNAKRRLAALTA